ncbi:MAG TPA: FtsX-like permease family protein [Candidatus Limnocylindrales bacterium]|nr:FtsX-like permease family protein [Candidatus Limnocylindrales bacterium]
MVLAAGALLLCATVLLAAGAVYGDVVADGGMRRAILDAPPQDRVVVVTSTAGPADVGAIDEAVTEHATEILGASGGDVGLVIRTGGFVQAGLDPDDPGGLTRLAAYRAIEDHATLVDGRWPEPGGEPFEAVLSEGAATALDAAPGSTLELVSRDNPSVTARVRIVGIWRADRDDPYWTADALELEGVETRGPFTTSGPIVISSDDLVRRLGVRELDLAWRAYPHVDGLRVDGLESLRAGIESLDERLRDARLPGRSLRVVSELPGTLAQLDRATLVSRSGVMLLTVQFAILAGYAIVLVAGMLIERRRVESALLRSRGASTLHLAAMAFGEALLLAIPAAIVAPWLAVWVVQLLGSVGPLAEARIVSTATVDTGVMLVAGVAAFACVLALTLPSLVGGGDPAGVRARLARQVGRTFATRIGVDFVLVVVAAIGLWQLRLYGSPLTENARGTLGFDPLLVAAPGIGLLAGGIVATRLVPRLAEIAERVLDRRRGLVPAIGSRQLARRPLRYTRSALLLMLAAALGTFAASDAATWQRSQADQATYQVAADVRVGFDDLALPSWAVGPAIRSFAGVTDARPIVRGTVDVGRAVRSGQLLGIDPVATQPLVNYPNADAATRLPPLLAGLADARPSNAAVPLDGELRRLAVVLDAAIVADTEADPQATIPPDYTGIAITVLLEDADGRLHRVTGESGRFAGDGQRIEISLSTVVAGMEVAFPGPARLQAIELSFVGPRDVIAIGRVDVRRVEASPTTGGRDWVDVGWAPNAAGWRWVAIRSGDDRSYRPPPGGPGSIVFGYEPELAEPLYGGGSAVFRSVATPAEAAVLPAVVSDAFLAESGAAVGEELAVAVTGQRLTMRVVGSTPDFPSLDPRVPFAIVDATTLERARQAGTGQLVPTREWWLKVDPPSAPVVEEALRRAPVAADDVVGRESLTRSLAGDPVSLGIIGALGLGALAALVFAAIGFVVSATVATSERVTEFAILRALGLSVRELSAWVSLENAFLLVFGLVAGSGLGILLAWLVLPFATLTESGEAAVPAAEIVVPWTAMLPIYVAALALFAVTVVVVTRQVRAAAISTVLRAGDE